MSERLKDPSKAAHEIIEVQEDGDAIRNDGVVLQAANKNAWYVLATIYGEQPEGATWMHHDEKLATKNQQAWSGWLSGRRPSHEVAEITNRFRRRLEDETAELPDRRGKVDFSKVFFSTTVCFGQYRFETECEFVEAHFAGNVLFNSSSFSGNVFFIEATFKGIADFRHTEFKFSSNFRSALFEDVALFNSANFNSNVCYQSATFRSGVSFEGANFEGETQFDWYDYRGVGHVKAPYPVRFFGKVVFNTAKFKSKTRFNEAQFNAHVPEFHAADIYDDTIFPTSSEDLKHWPPLKGEGVMDAADQKRAYNRLRLFMNRSLQIDEEQFFHRMEMRCKRETSNGVHAPIYWFYEKLSDYGSSVVRPVVGMGMLIVIGAALMLFYLEMEKPATGAQFWTSTGWSISNTLPFLGFGKLYFGGKFAAGLPVWLKIVGGVQTLFGFVLLFLFGLGLRNRFRLR